MDDFIAADDEAATALSSVLSTPTDVPRPGSDAYSRRGERAERREALPPGPHLLSRGSATQKSPDAAFSAKLIDPAVRATATAAWACVRFARM